MGQTKDLTGKRFGSLTVIRKTEEKQGRYCTWLCRCDCGNEVTVSTKYLTACRSAHCGCRSAELINAHIKPKDRTGKKYGGLTVLRLIGKSDRGEFLWDCECECGNRIAVPAKMLDRGETKDCGCGCGEKPKYRDLTGMRQGMLTAMHPTAKRDKKGSVIWCCKCDCGNETEISESNFLHGSYVSCGCIRRKLYSELSSADLLTFIDGTCVEMIANRKSRSDNTSGCRGVSRCRDDKFRAYIGLQGKKYSLGRYDTLAEAASVRAAVEEQLFEGFLSCWEEWNRKASVDSQWAERNPFFFSVCKEERTFWVASAVTGQRAFHY